MAEKMELLRRFGMLKSVPEFFLEDVEIAMIKDTSEVNIDGPAVPNGILTFVVENISELEDGDEVASPPFFIRNLQWMIVAGAHVTDGLKVLKFYLLYDGTHRGIFWDCRGKATLRLLAGRPGTRKLEKQIDEVFTGLNYYWGDETFIDWASLVDPANGYVHGDCITLVVDLDASVPVKDGEIFMKRTKYFGTSGAIVVTRSDEVFAISTEQAGFLGLNIDSKTADRIHRINALCNRGIVGLAMGSAHFAAWSASGEVFVWGANESGQLGIGHVHPVKEPQLVKGLLKRKRVVKVACGLDHTLCLTEDGQVFVMGNSDFYQTGNDIPPSSPTCMSLISLTNSMAVDIACCHLASFAVMNDGSVIGWGSNTEGQLGGEVNKLGDYVFPPIKIAVNARIKKIACGPSFCLALSDTKEMHYWGSGSSSRHRSVEPEKLCSGSVDDIGATIFSYTCFCIIDGAVVVWGNNWEWYGDHIDFAERRVTMFRSIDDAMSQNLSSNGFLCFSSHKEIPPASMSKFDQEAYYWDVKFEVNGNILKASKYQLILRCEYFAKMFTDSGWKESMSREPLKVDLFNLSEFNSFLGFIHSGRLIVSDDLYVLIEIMKLADYYGCPSLQSAVTEALQEALQKRSAFDIYIAGLKYNAKSLRMIALDYIAPRYAECAKATDISAIDSDCMKQLMIDLHTMDTFK